MSDSLNPTANPGNELTPSPATVAEPSDGLYPPQSLWRLYLLTFLTLGIYVPFWGYRLTADLNAMAGCKYKPLANWFGYLLPLVRWFLMMKHLGVVEELARNNAYKWFSAGGVVALIVAIDIASGAVNLTDLVWPSLAIIIVYPVPFVLAQHQINLVKGSVEPRRYRGTAYRFSSGQIVAAVFLSPIAAILFWVSGEELLSIRHPKMQAGTAVSVGHGLEFRAPPGWRLAEPTWLNEEAEFSMLGPTGASFGLVYSHQDSLDDVVDYRRDAIRADGDNFTASETRRFFSDSRHVVSYATYEIEDIWGKNQWVVTTVELDDLVFELLTATDDSDREYAALETFSRTLRLVPEP